MSPERVVAPTDRVEETPGRASLEKLGCRTPPQLHAGGVGQQQPYGRGILQSRSHDCPICSHKCPVYPILLLGVLLSFVVACVLYVSFGSKVRPRTFGCVIMGSAVLFMFWSRLLLYSAASGVNRVQVVLSGFSVRLFCSRKNFM